MTLGLDGTASARAAANLTGLHFLIELDFSTGTLYYSTYADTKTIGGHAYLGLGQVLELGVITQSENAQPEKIILKLNVVSAALLAACTGDGSVYRGREARLYAQFFSPDGNPEGAAVLVRRCQMNKVAVPRKAPESGGSLSGGAIELELVRPGHARMRNKDGLRRTHAQQIALYPGDNGLEYTQGLLEKPVVWLSKKFQQI
jgi:hypothetical protein